MLKTEITLDGHAAGFAAAVLRRAADEMVKHCQPFDPNGNVGCDVGLINQVIEALDEADRIVIDESNFKREDV